MQRYYYDLSVSGVSAVSALALTPNRRVFTGQCIGVSGVSAPPGHTMLTARKKAPVSALHGALTVRRADIADRCKNRSGLLFLFPCNRGKGTQDR